MIAPLATGLIALSLLIAVWGLAKVLRHSPLDAQRHRSDLALVGALAVLEVGLLVQTVVGFVRLAGGAQVSGALFGGYAIGALVVVPAAGLWALADRSRGGPGVLVVCGLVIAVMVLRLEQIWGG